MPGALFDIFATSLLKAVGKRPQFQVRTWLNELMNLSLLLGGFEAGFMTFDRTVQLQT